MKSDAYQIDPVSMIPTYIPTTLWLYYPPSNSLELHLVSYVCPVMLEIKSFWRWVRHDDLGRI